MTLRSEAKFHSDPPAGFDGQFHWGYLEPAFLRATERAIRPMDIDGHVEINGQHLIFETKDSGIAVPAGQRQALMQLWAKGYVTLVFLWGKTDPMKCEIFWPKGFKTTIGERKLTKEKLAEICESWARWAERTPCPFRYSDPNA